MPHKEVPKDIQDLLKSVADHFDLEDRSVRERQIRQWRRFKLYWNGFQNVYWSEVAHDWRIWDKQQNAEDTDQSFYDKPINVFRAYLESIIAALSVIVPPVKCFPDDATNPLDLSTAKAGDKIAELIYKHNKMMLVWIHGLFIYCTEGLVATYNYTKEDKSFGTYEEKHYEDQEEIARICPECEAQLDDNIFEPDNYNAEIDDIPGPACPGCAVGLDPFLQPSTFTVTRLTGITKRPKSRQIVETWGGLYVKTPNYAMTQAEMPYLRFSYETHYSNVVEQYPDLKIDITGQSKIGPTSSGIYDPYEAWGRLSPQYNGEYPVNTVTVNNYWFRVQAFNVLNEEDTKKLKNHFPNGCKYVKINEFMAEAYEESLDDHWTLVHNPLSDYLHYDPLGLLLTSIQDITNDLTSLTIQTIEHGIPQTFVDPTVLNFDQYKQTETVPGGIFPAVPKAGKSVGDGFYEVKTATLSREILPFGQNIQQLGQLVSGALPSLFGGAQPNSSKTAAQYAMSRSQAQQRLQTVWKMFNAMWEDVFGKVIPAYINDVMEDENDVEQDDNGNFINVFIRKAELQGKIGKIEIEASDELPVTWSQKKDVIMSLMQGGNPVVMEAIMSPENLPFIKDAIGINEFVIPGEADRQKQYEEIQLLVNSEPIVMPPDPAMVEEAMVAGGPEMAEQAMQPQELPSVEVDPIVDNHQIEADICRQWLISETGRLAKTENPAGYKNVLLHMKAHMDILQQRMQQQMEQQLMMQEQANPSKSADKGGRSNPKEGKKNQSVAAPLKGEQDVTSRIN